MSRQRHATIWRPLPPDYSPSGQIAREPLSEDARTAEGARRRPPARFAPLAFWEGRWLNHCSFVPRRTRSGSRTALAFASPGTDNGRGPETILFIPTWNFVDSRVLRHQVDGLRDRFRVLTYDARGCGGSDRPPVGYRFTDHLEDAVAVLDATETAAASVVAASAGTHVAALLAQRHPDRVRRLVLVAPPMDVPADDRRDSPPEKEHEAPPPNWRTDYTAFVPWFINTSFPEPGSETTIKEIVEIALEADHAMLLQQSAEFDWDEAPRHLDAVRCRTLIIHGTADRTLDVDSVKAVASAIPGADLALLDSLGHRPDISRPAIVNPILGDFLGHRPSARFGSR
jgi:pimeloyl-ACP methyl ester carboxylesterase